MGARLMAVHGIVQRDPESDVIHVVVRQLEDDTAVLGEFKRRSHAIDPRAKATAPEVGGNRGAAHPRYVQIIPKSRDFH